MTKWDKLTKNITFKYKSDEEKVWNQAKEGVLIAFDGGNNVRVLVGTEDKNKVAVSIPIMIETVKRLGLEEYVDKNIIKPELKVNNSNMYKDRLGKTICAMNEMLPEFIKYVKHVHTKHDREFGKKEAEAVCDIFATATQCMEEVMNSLEEEE